MTAAARTGLDDDDDGRGYLDDGGMAGVTAASDGTTPVSTGRGALLGFPPCQHTRHGRCRCREQPTSPTNM